MSLLSGTIHQLGNVAAPLLEGYGALTHQSGAYNAGKAISNPNITATNFGALNPFVNASVFSGGAPSGGGGGTAPQPNAYSGTSTAYGANDANGKVLGVNTGPTAAQIAANNQAIDLANYNLGLLPGALQSSLNNVQHAYDQNNNELQSGFNAAQQNYGQSTDQNQQQFVTNKNAIMNQGSNGLRGLLRLLGQHGAGGSSAVDAANGAVAETMAQQRAGAGQTYGQNQQALDTSFNTYQTGFDNSKKQLADWLTQQQNMARSNNESNRQNILQQLAGLQANATAAQPYIDQIKASAANVANLQNFNPTYTGVTPTYTAPDVASYTVDQVGNPTLGQLGNNTGGSSALSFLLGLNKDKQNPVLG